MSACLDCSAPTADYRSTRCAPCEDARRRKPITHGTLAGYQRGCHCDSCMEAMRTYYRELRRRKRPPNSRSYPNASPYRVDIDIAAFASEVKRDGRPIAVLMRDAGVDGSAYYRILERGRCTLTTFDRICSTLGLNGYEIEVMS